MDISLETVQGPSKCTIDQWSVMCNCVLAHIDVNLLVPVVKSLCVGIGCGWGGGSVEVSYLQATGSFWGSYQQPPYCTSTSSCPAGSGKLSLQHGSPPSFLSPTLLCQYQSALRLATNWGIVSSWRTEWETDETHRTVKERGGWERWEWHMDKAPWHPLPHFECVCIQRTNKYVFTFALILSL